MVDTSIFKAYDIRGIYGKTFTEEVATRCGRAFALHTKAAKVLVGRDMRASSPSLAQAFMQGVMAEGVSVIDLGQVGTEMLYFAAGKMNFPGAMFTASHNPKEWNGVKFCRAGALPVGEETGLKDIQKLVVDGTFSPAAKEGVREEHDIYNEYARHALSFIDASHIAPLTVAVDAGNGMAGKMAPAVLQHLPVKIVPLYMELDGNFPNHPASPIEIENVQDLIRAVKEKKCDVGMAFDGDGDRVFFIDERGARVPASLIVALIAKRMLEKNPGTTVIHNVVTSRIVPETVLHAGGTPLEERVGHSFIKARMRETNAVFAGEHSGHYYYRDNYMADSAMITALIVLEAMSTAHAPLSRVLAEFQKYFAIEETNTRITDKISALARLEARYGNEATKISKFDGATFTFPHFWFNVRPSNTESLLRLNLEADSQELMQEKAAEVLAVIREK